MELRSSIPRTQTPVLASPLKGVMDQMESTPVKDSILSSYDQIFDAHYSDIEKVNEKINADCEKFIRYYEESCSEMEAYRKSLQQRENEIKKKEDKLQKEKKRQELKITLRERLSSCKQMVNESFNSRKAAEGLMNELEMLHKRRAELEAQLRAENYESLQSEILQLETALEVILVQDDDSNQEIMKNLKNELIEKDEQLQDLKDDQNSRRLFIQEINDELQEGRWELTDGLKTYLEGTRSTLGTKRMGLVDSDPFLVGCNSSEKKKENATKFASLCNHLVEDPDWHPFTAMADGSEIINEEDAKMMILKAECSEEQYGAVVKALIERNQYKQSGRDVMRELWNYKEKRKASLREGIEYMLKEWKIHKKRKR